MPVTPTLKSGRDESGLRSTTKVRANSSSDMVTRKPSVV